MYSYTVSLTEPVDLSTLVGPDEPRSTILEVVDNNSNEFNTTTVEYRFLEIDQKTKTFKTLKDNEGLILRNSLTLTYMSPVVEKTIKTTNNTVAAIHTSLKGDLFTHITKNNNVERLLVSDIIGRSFPYRNVGTALWLVTPVFKFNPEGTKNNHYVMLVILETSNGELAKLGYRDMDIETVDLNGYVKESNPSLPIKDTIMEFLKDIVHNELKKFSL